MHGYLSTIRVSFVNPRHQPAVPKIGQWRYANRKGLSDQEWARNVEARRELCRQEEQYYEEQLQKGLEEDKYGRDLDSPVRALRVEDPAEEDRVAGENRERGFRRLRPADSAQNLERHHEARRQAEVSASSNSDSQLAGDEDFKASDLAEEEDSDAEEPELSDDSEAPAPRQKFQVDSRNADAYGFKDSRTQRQESASRTNGRAIRAARRQNNVSVENSYQGRTRRLRRFSSSSEESMVSQESELRPRQSRRRNRSLGHYAEHESYSEGRESDDFLPVFTTKPNLGRPSLLAKQIADFAFKPNKSGPASFKREKLAEAIKFAA